MPNQVNFPDAIPVPYINERLERLSASEINTIKAGEKQILFGTDARDVVEIWIYNSDGSVAGHTSLPPTNDILSLTTAIGTSGAYEMINLDMGKLFRLLSIEPGRYGTVVNFFRNEVGSESGNKLYISEISDDRTELKLSTKKEGILSNEISEWILPSVPKLAAQGLVDQTLGQSLDVHPTEMVTLDKILSVLEETLVKKLDFSGTISVFGNMIQSIVDEMRIRILDKMASDVQNLYIQSSDLEVYILESLNEILHELEENQLIDQRIKLV
jgi:hypothetical protein